MEEVIQVSAVPVNGIWCAFKLAPMSPFFPMFNISEARHGQNRVTILSTEKGKFGKNGTISRRIDLNRPESSGLLEVEIPSTYRIKLKLEDDTVETVYTNDNEAGYLLRLMSSVENIEKFHSMAMKGQWDKALEELMIDDKVDKSYVSTADKASLDQLAKSVGITLGP
jgi:hypothetical protein